MRAQKISVLFAVSMIVILFAGCIDNNNSPVSPDLPGPDPLPYFEHWYDNPPDQAELNTGYADFWGLAFTEGSTQYGLTPGLTNYESGHILGLEEGEAWTSTFIDGIPTIYTFSYVLGMIGGYADGFRAGWDNAYYGATGLEAEFGEGYYIGFIEASAILLQNAELP